MSPTVNSTLRSSTLRRYAVLFGELQDLKRQRPAHYSESIATVLFREAWAGLLAGEEPRAVGERTVAKALTNVLFPGCDHTFWPRAGLAPERTLAILRDALTKTAGSVLTAEQLAGLRLRLEAIVDGYYAVPPTAPSAISTAPASEPNNVVRDTGWKPSTFADVTRKEFARLLDLLCHQPRAGATRPGIPRLLLLPPEMHSDHCLLTAVYGYLLAGHYGADPGRVFVCALAHHLHNAVLPDCGFSGEVCLGDDLGAVIERCREVVLRELPDDLAGYVRKQLRFHDTIATPEGRAESAADVLDRVLDVKWRTRAAAVTDADILGDLDLVHPGPLREFQDTLLQKTGLWKLT